MKKTIFASLFLIAAYYGASGQSWKFSITNVPEILKNKASIITHFENIELKVEGLDKCVRKVHKIYTVLNDEGKAALFFNEYSSKAFSLEDVELKVYDANGKQLEKRKKKDMVTTAVGEGLVEDGYVTYYPVSVSNYPVTLEISYEQHFKSTLNIPDYYFISSEEGVVESNYTVRVPAELGMRFKGVNTDLMPEATAEGTYKVYKWTVKNMTPIEYEEGAVAARDKYPHIKVVTDQFSHYGFKGSLSSWKSFGKWINDLYTGLDVLPAERQQFFTQLVSGAPDDKEKIRRIYNYLQKNFRYVSIQLGIGGLRPFSAEFTDQKKYGDCKALSNYMKAALKSVGIRSHVAIINAQGNALPVDPDFPSNNFNHVILCVPRAKDSIWLECTSQTAEFGVLGTFTENRNALLITEDGGVLVPTPKSRSAANIISTVTTITVADDFSGATETVFTTRGEYGETINSMLKENRDRQKETLVFRFGFKHPDDFDLTKEGEGARLKMILRNVSEFKAGAKLFIHPRLYKLWSGSLPKSENRKMDFYFNYPFEKYDTTIFKFPAGTTPDVLPAAKEFSCDYATYQSKYWFNESENAVYVSMKLVLKQHRIPAAAYASVKNFFDNLAQDDAQKLVVKKGTSEKKPF